jgi:hypothetical protein
MKLIYLPLFSLFLFGCNSSDSTPDTAPQKSVAETNFEMWSTSSQSSYSFVYEEAGFTPLSGKWEIQVHNDEVIFVNYIGENNPEFGLEVSTAPSINSLFERVLSDSGDSCTVIDNEFDNNSYFPSNYYVSCGEEGSGFTVVDFIVQ